MFRIGDRVEYVGEDCYASSSIINPGDRGVVLEDGSEYPYVKWLNGPNSWAVSDDDLKLIGQQCYCNWVKYKKTHVRRYHKDCNVHKR